MKKTFKTTVVRNGPMCFIPLTFDPKPVFGRVRAPVKVTRNGYTYRSTIAAMGGPPCLPLRRSNREAAGLEGGETLSVRLELDTDKREVETPADLVRALKAAPPAWERWQTLSYSHQREHVEYIEQAKKTETRLCRISRVAAWAQALPARMPRTTMKQSNERLAMNSTWHQAHLMPRPATAAQRVAWHLAHQRQCGCREIPRSVQLLIDTNGGAARRTSRSAASSRAHGGKKSV